MTFIIILSIVFITSTYYKHLNIKNAPFDTNPYDIEDREAFLNLTRTIQNYSGMILTITVIVETLLQK